jgi:hypothetical protein
LQRIKQRVPSSCFQSHPDTRRNCAETSVPASFPEAADTSGAETDSKVPGCRKRTPHRSSRSLRIESCFPHADLRKRAAPHSGETPPMRYCARSAATHWNHGRPRASLPPDIRPVSESAAAGVTTSVFAGGGVARLASSVCVSAIFIQTPDRQSRAQLSRNFNSLAVQISVRHITITRGVVPPDSAPSHSGCALWAEPLSARTSTSGLRESQS